MENPRPLSPFVSSMVTGFEFHMARPVKGCSERDFIFDKISTELTIAKLPSLFALTNLKRGAEKTGGWVGESESVVRFIIQ